ncbi:phage major tail protein, TP901-1 family [Virgibacillus halophilus]|uniref:Phage major tail protein, TP901-1 family n=1 Tax=Tigheibacillus halophilus TaxID=361280 RepID=A0ABU5C633_9BACI|nr:phage major tail protein, TP901-1 family [Virgibacillus halophilus]
MAEEARKGMLQGKNKILLFRLLKESEKEAAKLSFQTGHTFSLSRDSDSITTKDGKIVKLGELEGEVTGIEAVQSKDDPVADMLLQAMLNGEKLELWEVTVDEDVKNEEGKYPAMYAQGYLTSWEEEASAEDEATYSGDYSIDLVPQFGFATLTPDQEEAVQYAFRDVKANSEPETEQEGE